MALIRTTDKTGYYVDIYRSKTEKPDPGQFHDYIYHNIGDVMHLTGDYKQLPDPKWYGGDIGDSYRQPGTHWLKPQYSTGLTSKAIKGTWRMALNLGAARTRVWFPEGIEREYLSALAPPTLEAPKPYSTAHTPVLVARRIGEAWSKPFEAIYEIYLRDSGSTIKEVRRLKASPGLSVLEIESQTNMGEEKQTVFSGDSSEASFSNEALSFRGRFGVYSEVDGNIEYIYLGDAIAASFKGWSVTFKDLKSGSAEIRFRDGVPKVYSDREMIIKKEY